MRDTRALLEAMGRFFEEQHLPRAGGVLVACSGGPDSTALLHLLVRYRDLRVPDLGLGVACLDHGLRGREGAEEAGFVEGMARSLGLPFRGGRADLAAGLDGASLEEAARKARYAFLERAAGELGLGAVATGHTRDDAAETFLLRLLRGSGRTGLCGLRPVRNLGEDLVLIRPLIDVAGADLRAWLEESGIDWRTDSSNADARFDRNRLRRDLLPALEAFSPGAWERVARASEILSAEEAWIEEEAERRLRNHLRPGPDVAHALDREGLLGEPSALRMRIVRRLLASAKGNLRRVARVHLDGIEKALGKGRGAVDLPGGWRAEIGPERLEVVPARPVEVLEAPYCCSLPIPGNVRTPTGFVLEAAPAGRVPSREELTALPRRIAMLDGAALMGDLRVRTRRPGDRMSPLGMGGRSRKVQDLMVDRKVPRPLRDGWPVLEAGGRIAWLAGLSVSHSFRVHEGTSEAVRVELVEAPEHSCR